MADETSRSWLFLSNHGTLLLSLAGHPTTGIGEIAELVGGSERGVQQIIGDLVAEGYSFEEEKDAAIDMRSTARRIYGTRFSRM